MLKRVQHDGRNRFAALLLLVATLILGVAAPASARDRVVVALQLEPPTLDPTSGAAAAVKEVSYRIIYEGLTTLDTTGRARIRASRTGAITDRRVTAWP